MGRTKISKGKYGMETRDGMLDRLISLPGADLLWVQGLLGGLRLRPLCSHSFQDDLPQGVVYLLIPDLAFPC